MRSFAEEKKAGTIELLLTRPLTDLQIILGKYFACLLLVLLALLPTLIYYVSVYALGEPKGNVDSAGVVGSYIGLVFLAAVFTSIGIFASAISKDQIISFIIAVLLCLLVYIGFDIVAGINVWGAFSTVISRLGISYHYNTISKGLIDSTDVLYFVSICAIMILATKLVLESRKW
jgi:ABC-2 type transport system permease protein